VIERRRFGGWLVGCNITAEDFLEAVTALRRAINLYTARALQASSASPVLCLLCVSQEQWHAEFA
jgi:hypothetical protein